MNRTLSVLAVLVALAAVSLGVYFGVRAGSSERAAAQEGGGQPTNPDPGPTTVPIRVRYVYGAKFLCGSLPWEAGVVNAYYLTKVNVHNPQSSTVSFAKKAIAIGDGKGETAKEPVGPSERILGSLPPDWGLEMDCYDIEALANEYKSKGQTTGQAASVFTAEGFVVIESPSPLDVRSVYSASSIGAFAGEPQAAGIGPDLALDVEPVDPVNVDYRINVFAGCGGPC